MRRFADLTVSLIVSFQSTHPLRDATIKQWFTVHNFKNFNPRTPYGMRQLDGFLSASSYALFQSTHPLRDATMFVSSILTQSFISIHAPLTGCDIVGVYSLLHMLISIHAPLTGCDTISLLIFMQLTGFQSTHPLRDAT